MTEQEWRRLVGVPAPPEAVERAARARRAALRQLDIEPEPAFRRWLMLATGAAAVCCGLLVMNPRMNDAAPAPERLQVRWKLSDGTAVHWVFDDAFALKGRP